MSATIGADDLGVFRSPHPDLLREISGIEPVKAGTHVLLGPYGVQSTQRLAIGDIGGDPVVALWPAELKEQALYLYGERLGSPMIAEARAHDWTAEPSPHLAFRNSRASLRLYMSPTVDASEYVWRWETTDLGRVGQHTRREVREELWPWLKSQDYASDGDDAVLDEWLGRCLGNRPALLRPGLRLTRNIKAASVAAPRPTRTTSASIRSEIDAILAAANEPLLPASRNRQESNSP